ncbi:MAG TPA: hypothetical protein VK419_17410 [Bryobacteraceae bacterium]|nr:hypothetical protein [Bryobacteraceae bacterium]
MSCYTTSSEAQVLFLDREGSARPVFLNPMEVEARKTVEVQPLSLKNFLGQEMSLVPEVEAVYVSAENRTLHVWIVVDEFERRTREKIYERETAIIDEFGAYDFGFNILSRRGRNLVSVINDPTLDVAFVRERCGDKERISV